MRSEILYGLDIGSDSLKLAAIEKNKANLRALLLLAQQTQGIRRGLVSEIPSLIHSLENLALQAEERLGQNLGALAIGISNPDIRAKLQKGSIIISREDGEISATDINRVLQSARVGALPPNRLMLHTIPVSYSVDGATGIKDPTGMMGSKLEVDSIIIDVLEKPIANLTKAIQEAGLKYYSLAFGPLAGSFVALSKRDRQIGTLAVDFGSDITSVILFEEETVVDLETFSIGSFHITQDLAIGLKTSIDVAEEIKNQYGEALAKSVSKKEKIEINQDNGSGLISRHYVAQVVEARIEELMHLILNFLRRLNKEGRLPGGLVFFGGGAKIPGLCQVARDILKLPARLSIDQKSFFSDDNYHLEFVNAIGLALLSKENKEESFSRSSLGRKLKNWLKFFAP